MLQRASILTVFFILLSGPGMWVVLHSAVAGEQPPGGVVMVNEEHPGAAAPQTGQRHVVASSASASASASAKASASASNDKSKRGGCQAESSSSAEARSGEEHAFEQDQDTAYDENGKCSAKAKSSARATNGR